MPQEVGRTIGVLRGRRVNCASSEFAMSLSVLERRISIG